MFSSPLLVKRSRRRSRVLAMYAVSLGFRPRPCAQDRKIIIAVEILCRLADIDLSRSGTWPRRQASSPDCCSHPIPCRTSIADTTLRAASADSAAAAIRASSLFWFSLGITGKNISICQVDHRRCGAELAGGTTRYVPFRLPGAAWLTTSRASAAVNPKAAYRESQKSARSYWWLAWSWCPIIATDVGGRCWGF